MKKILVVLIIAVMFLYQGNFTQVFSNDTDPIVNIEIGKTQTAIVTQSGRVFTWGDNFRGLIGNGEFGRDENNNYRIQQTPYELTSAFNLNDDKVIDIEFNNSVGFALTEKGKIFYWSSLVSMPVSVIEITNQLTLNENEQINEMVAFNGTSYFRSNQNRMFAYGVNSLGILGENTPTLNTITLIDNNFTLNEGETIQTIDASSYSGAMVTNQRLFKAGTNFRGAMGYDNADTATVNAIAEESLVDITSYLGLADDEAITMHKMTDYNSFVLTSENRMLSWGNNYYGLVGNGGDRDAHQYKPLDITSYFELNENEVFVDFVTTRNAVIFMTNQRLFMLGNNQYRFGLVSTEPRIATPLDITEAFNFAPGEYPAFIDTQHSDLMSVGMITNHNNVYMWGNYASYKMLYFEAKNSSAAMYVTEPVLIQDYFDDYQPPTYTGDTLFEYEASNQEVDWKTLIEENVSDNDAQNITVTVIETPTMNEVGLQEVLYTLEDDSGNVRVDTIDVSIVDTTAPILTSAIESIRVPSRNEIDYQLTTTDNASGEIQIIFLTPSFNIENVSTQTVRIQAKDASGNLSEIITIQVVIYDATPPTITLVGDAEITIEVGSVYEDLGAIVDDNHSNNLVATVGGDTVDVNTVGTYTITYDALDAEGNEATQVTRTVNVVDTTAPVITLTGDAEVTLEVGSTYNELGATFTDNYDQDGNAIVGGDVVDVNTLGTYTVNYNVTDTNGNVATQVTRTVNIVDTTAPVITLTGDAEVTLEAGSTYNELGATFTDNYDQDGNATIGGDAVDTNTLGTYIVTYNVTDTSGNVATQVTRTVNVVDTTPPVITLTGDAEIILSVGDVYEEFGATVTDNYDTNLNIVIGGDIVDTEVEGTYVVTYNVTDSEGNVATQVTRTIIVESTSSPALVIIVSIISVSALSAGGAFLYIKKIKPSLNK